MNYQISQRLWQQLHHFASFPQTGISLRQMVQFGRNPNPGTILQAGSFLHEELPIRLAHRVKELDELPHDLSKMPSIVKVKNWYAQSFEELVNFPKPTMSGAVQKLLQSASKTAEPLPESKPNPSLLESASIGDGEAGMAKALAPRNGNGKNGNGSKSRALLEHRYYANLPDQQWPVEIDQYNEDFTKALEKIKKRHDAVVTTIAQGVLEYKRSRKANTLQADVQAFLDRFYLSRIGIRILIGQHIALSRSSQRPAANLIGGGGSGSTVSSSGDYSLSDQIARVKVDGNQEHEQYVGIICTNTNVGAMAHEAIENARFVCEEHYGLFKGPPVQLVCPPDLTFMYVPSHLNHMLFELLKNSLRAVVERYGVDQEDNFPPIKVIVVEGKEDITIKISDEGGGIPRSEMPLVWTYMYTTAQSEDLDPEFNASDFKAPMAGFGYGLPLARLYARYFGGDLKLISMEGYGTDVYLHLNRLSSSSEPLPEIEAQARASSDGRGRDEASSKTRKQQPSLLELPAFGFADPVPPPYSQQPGLDDQHRFGPAPPHAAGAAASTGGGLAFLRALLPKSWQRRWAPHSDSTEDSRLRDDGTGAHPGTRPPPPPPPSSGSEAQIGRGP
ncbi:alpha-ketoacid dehydrogenase kinase [Moesziomyces antarcticus]|uniref:Protein-serine/threonine kinase n=1 Tax=Pseudozyma antarctica TaxID=84753 RepID=A0A081CKX4_PSEA2|nr:alpha-ketoacid dehydrogenase kinase [Moesziomyces antarcticus]GAK67320.1 alpha-ketoacid dehydrogenase kinase [Moesziomyces antarcticus]